MIREEYRIFVVRYLYKRLVKVLRLFLCPEPNFNYLRVQI